MNKIQLAAALVAALGINAPAFADESTTTDKTVKSSKVQLDDTAKKEKKEKKGAKKSDKSCKKGDKSCKAADGAAGDKK